MVKKPTSRDDNPDEMEIWNREDALDLVRPQRLDAYNVVVAARDWTVDTIIQQVKEGNIDLDPAFQRRNAWRDDRRSRLIESFILGFPVPQIVLAENPHRRKSFIVIDGRQRLMTIAGFYLAEYRDYWLDPKFAGLKVLQRLNGESIDNFMRSGVYTDERRRLANADIRTAVLTGFKDEGVLYDVFYRINTGSVPLSSQELRQVLNRGAFAQYLLATTSVTNPLWDVLNISAPDSRLRDVELLLRLIAWKRFAEQYTGNIKQFLDDAMGDLNRDWLKEHARIGNITNQVFAAVEMARKVFGDNVGRKYSPTGFERAFNRAVFEVQVYYLATPALRTAGRKHKAAIVGAFKKLCGDRRFLSAVEATTKSIENTRIRFELYRLMLQRVFGSRITAVQIGPNEA